MSEFRRRVAKSPIARAAIMPKRLRMVARYDARVLSRSARWLAQSREHTNYTYRLAPRNREHLAWWLAAVTGVDIDELRVYLDEVEDDEQLRGHLVQKTRESDLWRLADTDVRYARRIGWYALVRAIRPAHVVETGTDKGLGSCVLAAALLRNGSGRLTTIDISPDAGYLISGPYANTVDRVLGDSVAGLRALTAPVDMFLHDSWHSVEHEMAELRAVEPHLSPTAVVLSDNAHATDALLKWADESDRQFLFFAEYPEDHWYPGGGIGAAWTKNSLRN